MALLHSFENEGNWLFKRRGFLPLVLFVAAIPFIYGTDYNNISPVVVKLYTYSGIVLCAIGFCIRAITIGTTPKGTSGRNTKEQVAEQLNTSGIYSVLRHPLYLGNYLMWIGIVLYTENIFFVLIVSLLFWLYYERIMFAEERFLEKKFGQAFTDWSLRVPAFIPGIRGYRKSSIPFSFKSVIRREYSGVLAAVSGFIYIDVLKNSFAVTPATMAVSRTESFIFVFVVVVVLLIKLVKKRTSLLDEDDRS